MIALNRFLAQGEAVSAMMKQIRENRLTHAILITGDAGIGKWSLAMAIASALLCEGDQRERMPCGACRACIQTERLSHPDLIVMRKGAPLVPTDVKTVIPVSDVEEAIRLVGQRGFESDRHVVLIRHAEDLSEQAENKLLKTLEEPPEGTFFVLTCPSPEMLLPTIVSRCRMMKLHPWPDIEIHRALEEKGISGERARTALAEAGGSPGRALRMADDEVYWRFREEVVNDFFCCTRRSDLLPISGKWRERREQIGDAFSVMEQFISRLVRESRMGDGEAPADYPEPWKKFAREADAEDYVRLMDAVALARKRVRFSVQIQPVVEQLILTFMEAAKP